MNRTDPNHSIGRRSVLGGGDAQVFEMAQPIFRAIAAQWFHMGRWGSGEAMKLVVNTLLGLGMPAIAEAIALLTPAEVTEIEDRICATSSLIASTSYQQIQPQEGMATAICVVMIAFLLAAPNVLRCNRSEWKLRQMTPDRNEAHQAKIEPPSTTGCMPGSGDL